MLGQDIYLDNIIYEYLDFSSLENITRLNKSAMKLLDNDFFAKMYWSKKYKLIIDNGICEKGNREKGYLPMFTHLIYYYNLEFVLENYGYKVQTKMMVVDIIVNMIKLDLDIPILLGQKSALADIVTLIVLYKNNYDKSLKILKEKNKINSIMLSEKIYECETGRIFKNFYQKSLVEIMNQVVYGDLKEYFCFDATIFFNENLHEKMFCDGIDLYSNFLKKLLDDAIITNILFNEIMLCLIKKCKTILQVEHILKNTTIKLDEKIALCIINQQDKHRYYKSMLDREFNNESVISTELCIMCSEYITDENLYLINSGLIFITFPYYIRKNATAKSFRIY